MKNYLLRPLASLALAVALAATLSTNLTAHAQLGRATPPTPVSAAQFETMLKEAGLPDTVKDAALPLHESYFARFRDFETREVQPALESAHGGAMVLVVSVDDAKKDAESNRRLLQRAAQMDGQLVDELIGVLTTVDAVHAEALRNALTRRRCAALTPTTGFSANSLGFNLATTSALIDLDANARAPIAPTLDAYDIELTRLLERHAEATITRAVRAAEIREELGMTNAPEFAGGNDEAGAETGGQEAARDWFTKAREVQKRAGEEGAAVATRMRRLHRDTLTSIDSLLPPETARALRAEFARAVYPSLHVKSEFDALVKKARAKRAAGEIDDTVWSSVTALLDAHDQSARPLFDNAVLAADTLLAERGDANMFSFGGSDESNPNEDRVNAAREQIAALDARDSEALRALLGLDATPPQTLVNIGRGGEAFNGTIQLSHVSDEIEGAIGAAISAIVVGGDGDMMVFSGDELDDGASPFSFGGGGASSGVARPMTGDELDALATKTGFTADSRAVFDEIVADCAAARTAAEGEFGSAQQEMAFDSDGGMAMTFILSGGEETTKDPEAPAKLSAAVDAAEEKMFDDLKATAHADKVDATDAARRARARVRGLTGERGAQVADLVVIVDAANLEPATRALINEDLTAWDEGSLNVINTMRSEVKSLTAELERTMQEATKEITTDDGNGNISVSHSVEMSAEIGEKFQELGVKISKARTRVADLNTRTVAGFEAKLEGEPDARNAIVRGFLRAANPAIYKMPRDLSPFFTKAIATEGVTTDGVTRINALKVEWIETRETQCQAFIESEEAAKADQPSVPSDGGIRAMQAQMRERKLLRESLEQTEASIFRRLKDLLIIEVGSIKAEELGELPSPKKRSVPQIQFGR